MHNPLHRVWTTQGWIHMYALVFLAHVQVQYLYQTNEKIVVLVVSSNSARPPISGLANGRCDIARVSHAESACVLWRC
jgi:hypothetical protein